MDELDDPVLLRRLDPDGALERIRGLPEQCLEAWQAVEGFSLPAGYGDVDKVVIAGMGGSAIAGDFLQAFAAPVSASAIYVVRGYELPAWVDGRTLVIACSHSGDTEETLSVFGQALRLPAKKAVITGGGRLLELALAADIPALTYSYPPEPRSAFGHALGRLLAVAQAVGVVGGMAGQVTEAVEAMRTLRHLIDAGVPEARNPAKLLARRLHGKMPLIIGAGHLAPVARRWRTQLNENAKTLAFWDELPELDHNLVVGLSHPATATEDVHAIFIDHDLLSPRLRLRIEKTMSLFGRAGIHCERYVPPGSAMLVTQLAGVHFGDYVSFYLAMLNGVRPSEIDNLIWVKEQLAQPD